MPKRKSSYTKILKSSKHKQSWKKGQSCISNPEFDKFRKKAKNLSSLAQFGITDGPSKLTVQALRSHDETIEGEPAKHDVDVNSIDGRTSFASSYKTNCSNVTFSKIINRFSMSNLAAHKEILAVLEGAAEVIKSHGDEDNDTQYMAMLMLLLKTNKVTEVNQISAVLYLLSICIKRVPQTLLKLKSSEVMKVMLDILQTHINSKSQSFIKSAITILTTVLRCLDQSTWSLENTKHVYYSILCLVDSNMPKVRKVSQHAVGAVLRGSSFMLKDGGPMVHPATHDTATFCIHKLESFRKGADNNSLLFILGLLGDVMAVFSSSDLRKSCETILRLMTLSDSIVKTVCLSNLRKMFAMRPKNLSDEVNGQIISALYEYQPSAEDIQTSTQWLLVMQQAHSNLAKLNPALFICNLSRLFEICIKCMNHQLKLVQSATDVMLACVNECNIDVVQCATSMCSQQSQQQQPQQQQQHKEQVDNAMNKLMRKMEHALGYQYMSVWEHILLVIKRLIEFFGKACPSIFKNLLKSLSTMRGMQGFPHTHLLDGIVGSCIKCMGPRMVLQIVPLNITGENDDLTFPRSWLLPVMRDNVQDTDLNYFVEYFLPLASNIANTCKALSSKPERAALKAYEAIINQIWSLLPGFCTRPTDLVQSFPKVAQILGKMISTNDDVRLDILSSIRKLINHNIDNAKERSTLSHYSKNFIPMFCNLYTSTKTKKQTNDNNPDVLKFTEFTALPPSHTLAILDTFKVYLKVSTTEAIRNCSVVCLDKMKNMESSLFQRHLVMDLVIGLVPHLEDEHLMLAITWALENIDSEDRTTQKKSYRMLEEMCSSDASTHILMKQMQIISDKLVKSLSTCNPISKAPRLRCLQKILKKLDVQNNDFITSLLPEAVLCTKATGQKAKQAAFTLLVEMAQTYVNWNGKDAFQDFIVMLLPGLAGSNAHLVSCTVLAVSRVIFDCKSFVKLDLLEVLVENLCILLKSKSREIVQSGLSFFKSLLVGFSDWMDRFIKPLVGSLVSMKDDNKHHFRFKSKEIYVKLIRKFGIQLMLELVPASHHKLLNHIRKEQERLKKKKMKANDGDDNGDDDDGDHDNDKKSKKSLMRSDMRSIETGIEDLLRDTDSEVDDEFDSDEDTMNKSSKSKNVKKKIKSDKKKQSEGTYLKEDDDIIDFLDPTANQKVLAVRPDFKKTTKKKGADNFKVMPDGRIVIPNEEGTKDVKPKSEVEDAINLIDVADMKNRKRRLSLMKKNDFSDDDEDEDKSKFSYQSGGKGIHRPIKKDQKKTNILTGDTYKAKKARGDVRKGNLEPYAYYPLEAKMINRRCKTKLGSIVKKQRK